MVSFNRVVSFSSTGSQWICFQESADPGFLRGWGHIFLVRVDWKKKGKGIVNSVFFQRKGGGELLQKMKWMCIACIKKKKKKNHFFFPRMHGNHFNFQYYFQMCPFCRLAVQKLFYFHSEMSLSHQSFRIIQGFLFARVSLIITFSLFQSKLVIS